MERYLALIKLVLSVLLVESQLTHDVVQLLI